MDEYKAIILGLDGRKIKTDWTELIPILRLLDQNIDPRCRWDLIQRNFLHNFHLKMDIQDHIFNCEEVDDWDIFFMKKEEEYYKTDKFEELMKKLNQ